MIRRTDREGRIVLPIELRWAKDINTGDRVKFFVDGDRLVLQKVGCFFCGGIIGLTVFKCRNVCRICRKKAAETVGARKRTRAEERE
jgi:transcriptional pleiotropic regulator of transition state genes